MDAMENKEVLYQPGEEPAYLKEKIQRFKGELDLIYPDKEVVGLYNHHRQLGKKLTKLYRELGYSDGNALLRAYGYTVAADKQGRPSTVNADEIIEELKRRYADGPTCGTIGELVKENQDLASSFKTLMNNANELFGMTFGKYLKQQGVLAGKKSSAEDSAADNSKAKLLEAVTMELLKRYPDDTVCPDTLVKLRQDNSDLGLGSLNLWTKEVYNESAKEYLIRMGIMKKTEKPIEDGTSKKKGAAKCTAPKNYYRVIDQLDVDQMLEDVNPKYTWDETVYPKRKKIEVEESGRTITVECKLSTSLRTVERNTGLYNTYDMYEAVEQMLSTEEVRDMIYEMDPNCRSDAAQYARPEFREDTTNLTEEGYRQRLMFLSYAAYKIAEESVLRQIATEAPRKKNGTLAKNKIFRIAASGIAKYPDQVLQIIGKATTDTTLTISAVFRTISSEEVKLMENDFVCCHPEIFEIEKYLK